MANMFSGNQEKKIPRNFKECYKTDSVIQNLWLWCERLENWGKILLWVLITIGIIDTITAGIEAHQFIQEIGAETIEEIRGASAELGIEIPTVFEALVDNLLSWALYAFLEYCAYHVLALLIGSLATIVQHTKITANVTLYNTAKAEDAIDKFEEQDPNNDNSIKITEKYISSEHENKSAWVGTCDICKREAVVIREHIVKKGSENTKLHLCENCINNISDGYVC